MAPRDASHSRGINAVHSMQLQPFTCPPLVYPSAFELAYQQMSEHCMMVRSTEGVCKSWRPKIRWQPHRPQERRRALQGSKQISQFSKQDH